MFNNTLIKSDDFFHSPYIPPLRPSLNVTENKVDVYVNTLLSENWNEVDWHNLSELTKQEIVHHSIDYVRVYSNLIPVGPMDAVPYQIGNPWTLAPRNFNRFGASISLPSELASSYFAYGNCSLNEAELIFLADSCHAQPKLMERRFATIFHLIRDKDTLLLEGFNFDEIAEGEYQNQKFVARGWEDKKAYENAFQHMKNGNKDDEIIIEKRNQGLLGNLSKLSGRLIVYIGEGHLNQSLMMKLKHKKFVALYDKEVILDQKNNKDLLVEDYLSSGMDIYSEFKKNGVKLTRL